MTATSEPTLKLKDYLLKERPSEVASANSLARKFNLDRKQVERQLTAAGYTKASDSPVWSAPVSKSPDTITIGVDKTAANKFIKRSVTAFEDGSFVPNKRDLARYIGWVLGVAKDSVTISLTGVLNSKGESVVLPDLEPDTYPDASKVNYYDDAPTDIDEQVYNGALLETRYANDAP